jgi:nucleoside-diphosphate-sugar epimerase
MSEKKSPIIVTGSSGFIGRAVCAAFVQDGYPVIGLDRPDAGEPPGGVTNVPCDITAEQSVADAVERVRREFGNFISSVIHLAAYYDFSGEPSPLYEQVTVEGTRRLIRALRTLGVEQFVFSSTMLVHAAAAPGQKINESSPVDPKWDYPSSKVKTEELLIAERGTIPVVLLRIAGVYTDRCQSIPLANQIQRIYERRLTSKVFPGETSAGQAFIHLDDVVGAIRATVAHRKDLPPVAAVLIGEPETVSYDELQQTLARLIHGEREWQTTQIPKAVAKAGAWVQDQIPGVEEPFIKPWMIDLADEHYELDITRARKFLDWSPRHNLREALPHMVSALKADPEGFYRGNKLDGEPPRDEASAASRGAARG